MSRRKVTHDKVRRAQRPARIFAAGHNSWEFDFSPPRAAVRKILNEPARCYPCYHGDDNGVYNGCQVNICPYDEEHHVHHGVGTLVFDPHPYR